MRTCAICCSPLSGRQTRFCGRACATQGATAARTTRTMYPTVCSHCAVTFNAYDKKNRYCSPACGVAALHGPARRPKDPAARKAAAQRARRRRGAMQKLAAAAAGTSGGRARWAQGTCRRCGQCFIASANHDLPAYCSHRCARSDRKERYRARRVGAEVSAAGRFALHERDGWTCHICLDPVNRTAVVPALDAPVLDHVVPLARGGAHCAGNLRTAHFYCNSVKRDLDLAAVS